MKGEFIVQAYNVYIAGKANNNVLGAGIVVTDAMNNEALVYTHKVRLEDTNDYADKEVIAETMGIVQALRKIYVMLNNEGKIKKGGIVQIDILSSHEESYEWSAINSDLPCETAKAYNKAFLGAEKIFKLNVYEATESDYLNKAIALGEEVVNASPTTDKIRSALPTLSKANKIEKVRSALSFDIEVDPDVSLEEIKDAIDSAFDAMRIHLAKKGLRVSDRGYGLNAEVIPNLPTEAVYQSSDNE